MVVTSSIQFDDNPQGTFFAGQMLAGSIVLTANKPKQVAAVVLKINGVAHTQWQQKKHHNGRHYRHRHYKGQVDYIDSTTYLFGSDANQLLLIESGIHSYTFACNIPSNCPSSFEGSKGHVRYTVRVILVRPWKHDQTYTKGFTVIKMLDLNYESPLLKVPTNSDMQKVFCVWPCSTEPLKINVTMPQSGYVPGQRIPLRVLVTNDSRIPVKELSIKLVMIACYYSQDPLGGSTTERTTVTKLKGDPVMRNCRKLFNYELPVPATPPTCLNICRLIQISYQVDVEASMPGMHPNQVICVPITIGNIPLMQAAEVIAQQPSGSSTAPLNDFTPAETYEKSDQAHQAVTTAAPWDNNANLPPPNYEEAMHTQHAQINANEPYEYGESEFAPRYPVFSVPSPSAPPVDDFDGSPLNENMDNRKGTWL